MLIRSQTKPPSMWRTLVVVAVATLLLAQPQAWAVAGHKPAAVPVRAQAHKLFEQAEWHFHKARYRAALRDYGKAFELSRLRGFLLNMAHCHVRLGNSLEARKLYQRYLLVSPATDPRRASVKQAMANLDGHDRANAPVEPDVPPVVHVATSTHTRQSPRTAPVAEPTDTIVLPAPAPQLALAPSRASSQGLDLASSAAPPPSETKTSHAWVLPVAGAAVVLAGLATFFALRAGNDTVKEGTLGSLSR